MRRWAAALVAGVALYVWGKPELLQVYSFATQVQDRHGRLLHLSLAADQRYRVRTHVNAVAPSLVDATLLYEDRWFYWHPGINPVAVLKAAAGWLRGTSHRGASTLTMQLARLRFHINSATPWGKVQQMLRAVQLELYYSKTEILSAYLTLAPYGANIEGVQAASLIYFGKDAAQVSLAESLALAVMPQRPGQRAPDATGLENANLHAARVRLVRAWQKHHARVDDAELAVSDRLYLQPRGHLPWHAPHLALRLRQPEGGVVRTTLDASVQTLLERQIRAYLEPRSGEGLNNASAMLVDSRTMDVVASVGSADFANASIAGQVDGTLAPRSPGSALKPFIYALAVQQGLIHPRTLLKDAPMRFGAYSPENFDGHFAGPVQASDALIRSRNVPAVYLETQLRAQAGDDARAGLYGLLAQAGVARLQPPEHYGLALVLGALEVTMHELTALYAMLAQQGFYRPVREHMDTPMDTPRRVLSPEAAAITLDMLRQAGPLHHTPAVSMRDSVDIGWKTGTSYGFRDAWTVGLLGPYVLAVWVGNFNSQGNPAFVGRLAAAPLFFALSEALHAPLQLDHATPIPAAGLHVRHVEVCALSGQLPTEACPHRISTAFIPGVSPIATCDIHRTVALDAQGKRACPGQRGVQTRVYEMWPSDLGRLFELAGLPRTRPPAYGPLCNFDTLAETGRAPHITAPPSGVTVTLRASDDHPRIYLSATVDADVETLRWFVDDQFVGHSRGHEPLLWAARSGDFMVRVVDDSGRADARWVRVGLAP